MIKLLIILFLCLTSVSSFAQSIQQKLMALEKSVNGRIGLYAIDTGNNKSIQFRARERFPIQSTFKVMGVSAILRKSMTDPNLFQQKLFYKNQDLVFWSPITKQHINEGMTISELCATAIMYSDNTAINLLMKKMGGPETVNAFMRSIGDDSFNLNNWEPELNSDPNNSYDTSTPMAMEKSLQKLTFGNILASQQRQQLISWMKGNTTGNNRIRAGVPKEWIVADKTGSGSYGITNDIAILWPPHKAPIIVAILFVEKDKNATQREDVIASATRLLINELEMK